RTSAHLALHLSLHDALPIFSTVVSWGSAIIGKSGINYLYVLHGEQRLTVHRPMPVAADILADERITGAFDKGEKGAIVLIEKTLDRKSTRLNSSHVATSYAV